MFKNYFKTAWRHFRSGKMHSFINVVGLSLGMGVAILIGLWLYDEVTFDRQNENYDRVARVIQNVTNNGEVQTWWNMPYPLSEELRKNYGSDFKHIAMAVGWGDHMLTVKDKKIKQVGGFFEQEFPEMFKLKMLKGSRNALNDPSSFLLSASAAQAQFGNADPLNQVVKIDGGLMVKVGGVYEDFPRNSSFRDLNFIASWTFLYNNEPSFKTMEEPWRPNFTSVFVELNDQANFATASARIKDAKYKMVNDQLKQKKPELFLHPMSKWHLYAEFENGQNIGGLIEDVWMFGIIGVFVLLLACINFMNLSTARSEKRAKEVGIRKSVGSQRKQLIFQFFSESLLTTTFSFALSILLVWLSLPFFNKIADKQMQVLWGQPVFWLSGLAFVLLTTLVAGSYPALYLSAFKPLKVLKGTFKAGRYAALPRKVLVVVQFSVSITLIIGTIVVFRQLQFAKSRPVGYSREGLISIPLMNPSIHDHFEAVKSELMQTGAILSMAESQSPPTGVWSSSSGFSWKKKDPSLSTDFGSVNVSPDYGKTIAWEIKEGRDFSRAFTTDTSALILNEAAVRFMDLDNPVGETIMWWDQAFTVIGVIKDMIINSPYDEVTPVIFSLNNGPSSLAILRINPKLSTREALGHIEKVFKKFNTDQPFEYKFVDDDYAEKFGSEERLSRLASFFAILAIAISCLGLFGLTSFIAEQRKKEIGLRKVLGASIVSVWNLLSKDFISLVAISFLISMPVAYYFMHNWLEHYTYRTEIAWWVFAATGIGALGITLLTVSFQAIRAAMANPVESLRSE